MATTEKIIKHLQDREVELIQQAANRVEQAQNMVAQAQQQMQLILTQYMECLELLTGDDDPGSLRVDVESKKVFRILENVPRQGTKRKTRGKKTGGRKG